MPVTEIKRPNYYEGQYLGAADLVAAQEYQRQQDQRHRLGAHTWGIHVGLELEERLQPGSTDVVDVYVKPGYATDGFGRAIVVLQPYKITEALFAQFMFDPVLSAGIWVPVWLRYREEKTNPPTPDFAVCDIQGQTYPIVENCSLVIGDVEEQAYRVLENFLPLVGEKPLINQQRDPISVAGKSVDAAEPNLPIPPNVRIPDASVPYQELPDTGDKARWLIRLGSVRWLPPNPPATTAGHFVISATPAEKQNAREGRSYVGVVAESVLAPAGKLRIRDRFTPTIPANETDDLAAVEGSLRVDDTLTAKKDIRWGSNNSQLHSDQGGSIELGGDTTTPGTGTPYIDFHYNGKTEDFNTRIINDADGRLTADAGIFRATGNIRWGNNSQLHRDQGGSIELGGDPSIAGTGTPYIDFHYNGKIEDFNTRIVNDADKRLTVDAGIFRATGNATVAGNTGIGTLAPEQQLSVNAALNVDQANANNGTVNPGVTFGSASGEGIASKRTATGNQFGLDFYTASAVRLAITNVGNVGIGTGAPSNMLHVNGATGIRQNKLYFSGAVGGSSLSYNAHRDAANANWVFPDPTRAAVTLEMDDYAGTPRFEVWNTTLGATTSWIRRFAIDGNTGNVGIGTTTAPSARLDVTGNVNITGDLALGGQMSGSDQRLKSNIVPLTNVLEKIQQIHGVSFDWNATYASLGYSTERRQIGVLAQEVQRVFPELVTKWGTHDYLGLDYSRLSAVLVEAVKELAAHNEALSQRVQALERAKSTTRKSQPKPKERKRKIVKSTSLKTSLKNEVEAQPLKKL